MVRHRRVLRRFRCLLGFECGLWYFRNARTGEKARNVSPWAEGLARGYGHRWVMKVAWYVNGSVTSQTSFWVSVRGNPCASCWA